MSALRWTMTLALGAACAIILTGPSAASPWSLFPRAPAPAGSPAVARGAEVFQGRCEICHGSGIDRAGTLSLQAKYSGAKPALLEDRRDLTPQAVRFYVRNGVAMMPFFRKTEVSDAELDDLAAYLSRTR
jgi:mono/diheme cytochrome c family protein